MPVHIGLDQKDRLTRQKQLLNKRLGLDVAGGLGLQTEELFREEDLLVAQPEYQADRDRQQVGQSVRQRHKENGIGQWGQLGPQTVNRDY